MDGYEAVVYDLDGTLVHLAVDWETVARDVADTLRDRGVTPPNDLWSMLTHSSETGHRDAVEQVIERHEREGARASERLPTADELPLSVPVGVCSLNAESACHIALETHGLAAHVGAVVGRDSVDTEKPDPEPLLTVVDALDRSPDAVLFVGDSERDEETARRAGTAFRYV